MSRSPLRRRSRSPGRGLGVFGKLASILLPLTVTALAVVGVLSYTSASASLRHTALQSVEASALQEQFAVDTWVGQARDHIAEEATSTPVRSAVLALSRDPRAAPARQQLLDAWSGRRLDFTELFLLAPDTAKVLLSTEPSSVGRRKDDQLFYLQGRLAPYVEPPYFSLQLQSVAMTAAAPVHNAAGTLIGVLAGRLDLASLNAIVRGQARVRSSDDSFLVNRSSLFVTQPRLLRDPAVLQLGLHTAEVRACADRASGSLTYRDYRGVAVLGAFRRVASVDACLVVKTDVSQAFAPVRALGRRLLLVAAAVLVATVLALLLGARQLVLPLRRLRSGVARFGSGDFTVRLGSTARDEIGELAREFDQMASDIAAGEAELTRRRREAEHAADQLRETNAELEAFSYTVSHDLRSPVRAIPAFCQRFLGEYGAELHGDGLHYLQRIEHNAERLTGLIDDLLAFSRLGRQEVRRETVDMTRLTHDVAADLSAETEGRDVVVEVGELPPAEADPSLLRQALTNLLSNAFKYTRDQPRPRICVSASDTAGTVVYTVRDNGVGFDDRYSGKLFEIFQRLHTRAEFEGSGVGLATVRRIVQRHGGEVWAESVLGEGAAFHFTLDGGRPDVATSPLEEP